MARHRWLILAGAASVLVLGVTAFAWTRGDAAPNVLAGPQDVDYPPPSARLLRRLAESADAFRSGTTVFLVAQDTGNYDVAGGFYSLDSARTLARSLGATWYVYPTNTPKDGYGTGFAQIILPGCYKDTRTTRWVCPTMDSTTRTTLPVMRLDDVTRIDVIFNRRTGRPLTVRMDPEHAGATIYTIQDFDRFIVPYYTRLFGPAYAARQREELLGFVRRSLDSTR